MLEVGKTYKEGLNRIPEGIVFDFNQGGGFLRIVFDCPLANEVSGVKIGKIDLGLLEESGIIFFFIKFGELPWMDAPYNIALSEPFELQALTDDNQGYAVQIVLVDGMTGIVKALKLIELPNSMSLKFKGLVEKQRAAPVKNYDRVLNQIYSRYDTDDLLQEAEKYSL